MVQLPKTKKKSVEKPPHKVELVARLGAVGGAVGIVTSASSGTEYTILEEQDGETVKLLCPCIGFKNRQKCSHVDAYEAERARQDRQES